MPSHRKIEPVTNGGSASCFRRHLAQRAMCHKSGLAWLWQHKAGKGGESTATLANPLKTSWRSISWPLRFPASMLGFGLTAMAKTSSVFVNCDQRPKVAIPHSRSHVGELLEYTAAAKLPEAAWQPRRSGSTPTCSTSRHARLRRLRQGRRCL